MRQIEDVVRRGDTIDAFQVESRAQMQMMLRLRPHRFEGIVIEVAIIYSWTGRTALSTMKQRRRERIRPGWRS
ncbi:MAG: hypothetical protein J5I90_14595 [Caldilineales bacterium]|nr:hypothetical protein [Caldilineales bacterium]